MRVAIPLAPKGLPPLNRYFSDGELRAAHPDPGFIQYHSAEHTQIVRIMAYELALADGLPDSAARFLSEVALLHDWDPDRVPGTPARVPATLRVLGRDFTGKGRLTAGHPAGSSLLQERFGWSKQQLQMAFCLLYRTEFPFEGSHANTFYRQASPADKYARCVEGLPKDAQEFVLRQAPMLAQYVDQLSWYATQHFATVLEIVDGLVKELNLVATAPTTTQDLDTSAFLDGIRDPRTFQVDYLIASSFGVRDYALPGLDQVFQMLPGHYGATFRANQCAFAVFEEELARGAGAHTARAAGLSAFFHSKMQRSDDSVPSSP